MGSSFRKRCHSVLSVQWAHTSKGRGPVSAHSVLSTHLHYQLEQEIPVHVLVSLWHAYKKYWIYSFWIILSWWFQNRVFLDGDVHQCASKIYCIKMAIVCQFMDLNCQFDSSKCTCTGNNISSLYHHILFHRFL